MRRKKEWKKIKECWDEEVTIFEVKVGNGTVDGLKVTKPTGENTQS